MIIKGQRVLSWLFQSVRDTRRLPTPSDDSLYKPNGRTFHVKAPTKTNHPHTQAGGIIYAPAPFKPPATIGWFCCFRQSQQSEKRMLNWPSGLSAFFLRSAGEVPITSTRGVCPLFALFPHLLRLHDAPSLPHQVFLTRFPAS